MTPVRGPVGSDTWLRMLTVSYLVLSIIGEDTFELVEFCSKSEAARNVGRPVELICMCVRVCMCVCGAGGRMRMFAHGYMSNATEVTFFAKEPLGVWGLSCRYAFKP